MRGISTTNFEVFADDDIQKMVKQAVKRLFEDDPSEQLIEAKNTKDEALEKQAIKRLEEHWRAIAKCDDVRSALLKLADAYLHNDGSIDKTDERWGKGSSKYIGQAIQRYFGE